jgi:hypothetical protein
VGEGFEPALDHVQRHRLREAGLCDRVLHHGLPALCVDRHEVRTAKTLGMNVTLIPYALGRALARFQPSTGFGLAVSPAIIAALAAHGPTALWATLAAATLLSAAAVTRSALGDRREGGTGGGSGRAAGRGSG